MLYFAFLISIAIFIILCIALIKFAPRTLNNIYIFAYKKVSNRNKHISNKDILFKKTIKKLFITSYIIILITVLLIFFMLGLLKI